MDNARKVKRGEVIFKEGDQPTAVYMIQQGRVGLLLERSAKNLEVTTLGASQILGEHAIFSTARHEYTAQAQQETKVLEIPIDIMKQQFEKCPPGIKLLVKSLVDDMKAARKYMKTVKMETENRPCPQGIVHRIFTEVHLIARHIGKRNPEKTNEIEVSWSSLKLYATRFFGQSPQRLRNLMDVLAKLKMAELTMSKNDEGEEELSRIKIFDVQAFEDFAEFFQYHLFKGAKAEAIYVDPLALKVAKAIAEISVGAEVDHKGASRMEWSVVLTECKARFKLDIKNTHLDSLERKGLFVKRQSFDDGRTQISFDRTEFVKMATYWGILYEIDKWNDAGVVNMIDKEEPEVASALACGSCQGQISEQHKFCPHCGSKVETAA